MVKIAICDDDIMLASSMEALLINISRKQSFKIDVEVFSDGSELWKQLEFGNRYDIFYLDIEMNGLNGIEVARRIRENDIKAVLIYVSGFDSYLMELFEVEPFRFIKKPINESLFIDYFLKAYGRVEKKNEFFEYSFNKILHKIPVDEIICFQSFGRRVTVVHKDGEGTFYGKLNQIEKQMDRGNIPFLRIHQSYLISFRYITEMSFSSVVMVNGFKFQISEERQKMIRAKYGELLGGEYFDK